MINLYSTPARKLYLLPLHVSQSNNHMGQFCSETRSVIALIVIFIPSYSSTYTVPMNGF